MAVTLSTLKTMHNNGEKIAVLTCYDASFARVLDASGVDVLRVGDSLGMVIQGHTSTLPVKLAEMTYHTRCVARRMRARLHRRRPAVRQVPALARACVLQNQSGHASLDDLIVKMISLTDSYHTSLKHTGWPSFPKGEGLGRRP